jgi:hypothetical protein
MIPHSRFLPPLVERVSRPVHSVRTVKAKLRRIFTRQTKGARTLCVPHGVCHCSLFGKAVLLG